MSRLRNVALAGFVATPPAHFRRIAAQVVPGDGASWLLDPCAGRGAVGRALANRWNLKVAMVEINQERGQWVRRRADHAVVADAFATECGHGQFVAVFSNAPYDRDDQNVRMEWRFLQRFRDALCPGGLLVYVIPGYRMLQDGAIIPHLAQFYRDFRLFTLPEPNPYRQVILYAVRREARDTNSRAAVDWLKTTLQFGPPPLPDACADPYVLPARPRDRVHLRGQELDVEQVRLDGQASGLTLDDLFQGPTELNTRVVMPLKKGHLASIMAAGLLDNARVGDDVIRGSVRQATVQEETEDEDVTVERTVYYPRIVAFNPQASTFRILEESTGLGEYMREHATALARLALARFQPRYEFDFGALPEEVRWRIAHLSPGQPVPGKPPGLWPGQRHVLAALYTAAQQGVKTLFLEAAMGYGKSRIGASFLALFHCPGRAGWFVTEAHLVDQMVTECKATVPTAFVFKVECLEDAIRFARLVRHPDYHDRPCLAVIGKQTLKDGSGWRPAVVRQRTLVAMTLDQAAALSPAPERTRALEEDRDDGRPVAFPRQMVTVYRCPDCGRLQVYGQGDDKGQIIVDDEAYFAKTLRRCLYDIVQEESRTVRKSCEAFLGQIDRRIGGTQGRHQDGGLGRVACPAVRYARDAAGHRVPLVPVRRREPVPGQPGVWQVVWTDHEGHEVPLPRGARPGRVRLAVVEWLREAAPDVVGAVVFDEIQGYKSESTNSGYALADMLQLADVALLMTGTLHGGYSSSVFYLAHRASAAFRRRFGYRDVQRFVERYGFLERKTVQTEEPDSEYGTTLMKARTRTYVKEIPGSSPALVAEFLGCTVFTTLADLGVDLPPVEHRIVPVTLDRVHVREYDAYRERCIQAMKEAREQGVHLAGSFLHTLQGYAVAPWRDEALRDVDGQVWAAAPNLELACPDCLSVGQAGGAVYCEDLECPGHGKERVHRPRLFANEQALLDEVQAQRARGRRVVVFVGYTRTRDVVTTRLLPLCRQAGLRAIFCDVAADRRGDWIAKHGPFCDVMFVNYVSAQTGLNLVDFQTTVFFQVPYSCYTFQQAPARLRRPTQPLPVEVVYLNEVGTIVEQALALMFDKLAAASGFRGETLEGVLGEVASSGAFMDELMRRVVEDADVTGDLEALFARFCRQEQELDEFLKPYDLGIADTVTVAATRRTRPTPVQVGEVYQPVLFGEPAADRPTPTITDVDIQAAEQPSLL